MDIKKLTKEKLAKMIDHTKLEASDTSEDTAKLCNEAKDFGFAAVCINSSKVPLAAELLKDTDVKVCSVVGFPLGAMHTKAKAYEAKVAVEEGAEEIDMVINIGALRSKDYDFVKKDIEAVVKAAKSAKGIRGKCDCVKVILETGFLTDEEIVKACQLCEEAGADFVKTSTGFGPMGAFEKHVKLMKKTVGNRLKIKAAGGISTFKDAIRAIRAGADRLGTSASIPIIEGLDWLKLSPEWLIEEIPCKICPSRAANLAKQPKSVYSYYKAKCQSCPYNKKYNKFYE